MITRRLRRTAPLAAALFLGCSAAPATEPLPTCDAVGDICTVAGTGIAGFSGDDGPATSADLYLPMDLVFGPDQNGYIVDWNNHRIRRLDTKGFIRTIAGKGELGDETAEGVELETSFNHPTSAAFDPAGDLVIAAWHNSRLKRLNVATGELVNICGSGKRAYSGDGSPADKADLDLPAAVAFDAEGTLYFVDQANQLIRKLDTSNIVSRVAGQCVIGTCAPGQTPKPCPGGSLRQVCGDTASDDPGANAELCRSACAAAFEGEGTSALEARLAMPVGQAADPGGRIAFDASGNLIFADTRNHRVRQISKDGIIFTLSGNGTLGRTGDGGPALDAQLNKPIDVELGPDGDLYIADMGNSCIRAIDSAGTIRTVAGICGQRGATGDGGPASEAKLDHPYGIAFDRNGDLFVADTENSKIRRIRMR